MFAFIKYKESHQALKIGWTTLANKSKGQDPKWESNIWDYRHESSQLTMQYNRLISSRSICAAMLSLWAAFKWRYPGKGLVYHAVACQHGSHFSSSANRDLVAFGWYGMSGFLAEPIEWNWTSPTNNTFGSWLVHQRGSSHRSPVS